MSAVFADSFYFVARLNQRDQHHEKVLAFSRTFRAQVVTTDWILMEVADALAASECRARLREFILHLRKSVGYDVVPASRELIDPAIDLYHQHADKEWTLTDCVSFIVMRERRLSQALTGDHHFEQAGFVALLR
jgi:uncharacterized protein